MKVDKIIKNAKIYTSNVDMPLVTALVVKDGKFVYVGDENGLSDYEGDVTDLGGKFIMPGIIDSHVHVTIDLHCHTRRIKTGDGVGREVTPDLFREKVLEW